MGWLKRISRRMFGGNPLHEAAGAGRRSFAWLPSNPGAVAAMTATQTELRTRTEALSRAQQAQARNLENRSAYRAQMMDAVALGGALYGLVQPAVAFESVMADVKKVVNFDTPDQFGQMSKDVLLTSTRIPMAAEGIGAIVAAAVTGALGTSPATPAAMRGCRSSPMAS